MASEQIHKDDIGTIIHVTIVDAVTGNTVDLSSMTTMKFRFEKPDGDTFERTAVDEDVANGVIKYTTIEDDLDVAGLWKMQAEVVASGGPTSHLSEIWNFQVYDNITYPLP